jgi:hypothetical protein
MFDLPEKWVSKYLISASEPNKDAPPVQDAQHRKGAFQLSRRELV